MKRKIFSLFTCCALGSALFTGCGSSDSVTETDPETGKTTTYKTDPETGKKLDYLTITPLDDGFTLSFTNNSSANLYIESKSAVTKAITKQYFNNYTFLEELTCLSIEPYTEDSMRYECLPARYNSQSFSFVYDDEAKFYSTNNTEALATIKYNSSTDQIEIIK